MGMRIEEHLSTFLGYGIVPFTTDLRGARGGSFSSYIAYDVALVISSEMKGEMKFFSILDIGIIVRSHALVEKNGLAE